MDDDKATLIRYLEMVKVLIGTPDKWTQKAYARDKHGIRLWKMHEFYKGVCFCLSGAILHTCPGAIAPLVEVAVARTISNSFVSIAEFNDEHTHEEVLGLIDKTIERIKEQST